MSIRDDGLSGDHEVENDGAAAMTMRIDPAEWAALPLEAHTVLREVPLRDVTAIDLPGGGSGRTLEDVRAPPHELLTTSRAARALFALRLWLGRVFHWDRPEHDRPDTSYLPRISETLKARSVRPPGTMEGGFRLLYLLEHESLAEIRNATVHAFLCQVLREQAGGYRLYWGIYVIPTSRWTRPYMALIEPFRRFIVYPAIFSRIRRTWSARYRAAAVPAPAARSPS